MKNIAAAIGLVLTFLVGGGTFFVGSMYVEDSENYVLLFPLVVGAIFTGIAASLTYNVAFA